MSVQYKIGGTEVYISHYTLDKVVGKAIIGFKRKFRLGADVDSGDFVQQGWISALTEVRKGFKPDYPETFLYLVVMRSFMNETRKSGYRAKLTTTASAVTIKTSHGKTTEFSYEEMASASTVPTVEDSFMVREMSSAVDRLITKLSGEYPGCAIGAELIRAEVDGLSRKEATHTIGERTGVPRAKLWAGRRELVSKVKEQLQ
jgi:DNA-directed RNA polymerase specialized sigma24 family protein